MGAQENPTVLNERLSIHTAADAAAQWNELSSRHPELSQLLTGVQARLGLADLEALDALSGGVVGYSTETILSGNVPVPAELAGTDKGTAVNKLTATIVAKTYEGTGSEQVAACATVLRGDPSGEEIVDAFVLVGQKGSLIDTAEELVAGEAGTLVPRDGWWDALTRCLGGCGSTCLSAAVGCPKPSWQIFLICLAGRCGLCVVKCAACATCDCTWWCRIGVGCCNH
ncbi:MULTISPECIES: hypothetical protein [unclassified Streptomyces]|uniref:hypothetical protein n=1 Tax=unclassified Streptomyces TaxID=2593676 RepID=UPI00131B8ACF|nr:hypothetical protein [Streptomyces sp. NRRL F-2747]